MAHMDHMEHMDHSAHHHVPDDAMGHDDPCAHAGHGHAMVFHSGVCQEILFSGWMTTNALELFGSALAIFFAGVLYEFLL
uniref:Copper transport protein n=1 Tax=Heliothis virescens TaxID=7102 RepID=A0A2A4IZ52_HELVI